MMPHCMLCDSGFLYNTCVDNGSRAYRSTQNHPKILIHEEREATVISPTAILLTSLYSSVYLGPSSLPPSPHPPGVGAPHAPGVGAAKAPPGVGAFSAPPHPPPPPQPAGVGALALLAPGVGALYAPGVGAFKAPGVAAVTWAPGVGASYEFAPQLPAP